MLFVNVMVKDVQRARGFFTALGFRVREEFSDEKNVCIIINESAFAMLLNEEFFCGFTRKALVDAHTATEVMLAYSVDTKADVDRVLEDAIKLGATEARDPQDLGFMVSRAFSDLDGHIWEVVWMDPSAAPCTGNETASEGDSEPSAKKDKALGGR